MENEDKKPMGKVEEVLYCFGSYIHSECKDYALNQMLITDFILLKDANGQLTENIMVSREEGRCTIKKSSRHKYIDFYDKKLIHIIEKLIKTNA